MRLDRNEHVSSHLRSCQTIRSGGETWEISTLRKVQLRNSIPCRTLKPSSLPRSSDCVYAACFCLSDR